RLRGAVLGVGAAIAAALVPAMRTARTSPVAALTMRGREMSPVVLKPGWHGPAILLLLITGLIVAQRVSGMRAIGLVTTASIVLFGCLLATPLVGYGASWLKVLWARGFGSAGRMAASHLARYPRRTALVTATLGVGLGTVLMLAILGWSFEQSLVSVVGNQMKAQLLVTSTFAGGGYRFAPMSEEVIGELKHVTGVARIAAQQDLETTYGEDTVLVIAFDPEGFLDRRVADWTLDINDPEGALEAMAKGDAVAVSRSFANLHGTRAGDEIELHTPDGPHAFSVAAITSSVVQSGVLMSRKLYSVLWHDNLVSCIGVVVDAEADAAVVASEIARKLGYRHRIRVWQKSAILDHWAGQARQAFSVQYVMAAIALLLVLVGVSDTLAASVT